jgi:hypothetical protein
MQVSGGYIEVAMLATTKICASIITTLEGADIIQQMFLPQWEDSRYYRLTEHYIIATHTYM